jgi:hypothetical protein
MTAHFEMSDKPIKLIADVEQAELALRCLETVGKFDRPHGMMAVQFMLAMELQDRERWLGVARAAMKYFEETLVKADTLAAITTKFIYETELAELACRCIETASDGKYKRPDGLSAMQAILNLESEDQKKWLGVALVAVEYVSECIAKATRLQ